MGLSVIEAQREGKDDISQTCSVLWLIMTVILNTLRSTTQGQVRSPARHMPALPANSRFSGKYLCWTRARGSW